MIEATKISVNTQATKVSVKKEVTFDVSPEQIRESLVLAGLVPDDAKITSIRLHNDDPWKSEGPRSCEPADAVRIKLRWVEVVHG